MGGLRHRHPGRRGRRRDHDRRHAAQLDPADRTTSRRWTLKRAARPRASATSTSGSGAARCPATPASCRRCTTPACSASSASSPTPACRSSRRSDRGPASRRRAGRGRRAVLVHAEDPRAAARRGRVRAPYADFLASRPPAAENTRVAAAIDARPRGRRPACTSCTCPRPTRCRCSPRREPDGVRVTAETCPHYLTLAAEDVPDGATEFKCCPPIRDAANRGRAVGRRCADGADRPASSPTTRRARPSSSGATPATSRRPGAASRRCSSACRWSGPRRAARGHHARRRGALDGAAAGRPRRAAPQGPHRGRAPTPTWSRSTPTTTFVVDPAGCTTATRSRPYAGQTLRGVVRTTWLRGEPVDRRRPARPAS